MLTPLLVALALLAAPPVTAPDHTLLDGVLRRHVHDGRVDYGALKADPDLAKYVGALAAIDPDALPDRKEQLALWINAYNAFTLHAVVQLHPTIKSVQDPYPDFGFFKQKVHVLGGKKYSLDEIENAVVRPRFNDPRIHAALNCASVSCPPIAPYAFTGPRLDAQLDAQMRLFARDRGRNAIGAGGAKLSRIFEWYAKDFEAAGGVAAFLSGYLEPADGELVRKAPKLEFLDYDWRLNGK